MSAKLSQDFGSPIAALTPAEYVCDSLDLRDSLTRALSNYFHSGTSFIIALYQIYSSDMEIMCFTMFLFVFHCAV